MKSLLASDANEVIKTIQFSQRWLLLAALSYNTEENSFASDYIYDLSVKRTQRLKDNHSELWDEHSIYPEVFVEDSAWTYTSQHFPINDEIKGWLNDQRNYCKTFTS